MRSNSSRPLRFFGDVSQLFLLGCLVLFAAVWKASYGMVEASSYLLPRVVAVAGVVVAAVELVRGASRPREASEEEDGRVGQREGLPVIGAIGFAVVYFAAVPLLGFLLATGLAVAGFGYVTKFPRMKLVAVLAVAVPIVLHLAFVELLKAPLPAGALGALLF